MNNDSDSRLQTSDARLIVTRVTALLQKTFPPELLRASTRRLARGDHANPLDLEAFLALARQAGFAVEEADVIAAQIRAEETLSDAELQRRAGEEARRLRHFIAG